MDLKIGDVIKADSSEWRVSRVLKTYVIATALRGSAPSGFVAQFNNTEIEANYSFLQRCADGDLSALVELTPEEREQYEQRTWQLFFQRHIQFADCQATRRLLEDEFHGEPISLRGLDEISKRIDSSLPKRQI